MPGQPEPTRSNPRSNPRNRRPLRLLTLSLAALALLLAALSCTVRLAWIAHGPTAAGGIASTAITIHAGVIQYDRTAGLSIPNPNTTSTLIFNRQIQPGFRLNWSIHSTPASLRVDIPFAFLTLLTIALTAAVPLLRKYLRPPDPSLCPCGYPRHSLPPHAPCPECGRPSPPSPNLNTAGPASPQGPPTPPSRPQDR